MTYFANYLGSIVSTEKAEVEAALRKGVFGDGSFTLKSSGDGRNGVMDAKHDDSVGYLFHLRAGPNSGAGTAMIGIGTDEGSASGLLVSNKNGSGAGISLQNHPGAGFGAYFQNYAANPAFNLDLYTGAPGIRVNANLGAGFSDGVSTAGSTTFTSASATFTAGDVGQSIAQLTQVGSLSPSGCIPAGATIATYVNATTVTLSAAATASGTGIRFRVGNRAFNAATSLFKVVETDGSTLRVDWQYGFLNVKHGARFTSNSSGTIAMELRPASTLSASIMELRNNSGSAVLSRFDKNGTFMSTRSSAPADADLNTSEFALWGDFTVGASKLMIKAKNSAGTVVTGQIALA